jgi:hypothetical protein
VNCGNCGAVKPGDARFCGQCGGQLTISGSATAAPPGGWPPAVASQTPSSWRPRLVITAAAVVPVMLAAQVVTGWRVHWPAAVFGHGSHLTLRWTAGEAPLPADAVRTASQFVTLKDVACPAVLTCVAVGGYGPRGHIGGNLVETLSHGIWTAAAKPTGAVAGQSGFDLFGVACPAADTCVAVGFSADKLNVSSPFAETFSRGAWVPAVLPLPAGGTKEYPGETAGLYKVSCPSRDVCVAAGTYVAQDGSSQGLIETLSDGAWTATRAPLPAGALPGNRSGVDTDALYGISCPTVASCVAVGDYKDQDGHANGLIDTRSGTKWLPSIAPLPADAARGKSRRAGLSAAWCTAVGACEVAGSYTARNGANQGVIDMLSIGRWGAASAPLPSGAVAAKQGALLDSVACPATGTCVAAGSYVARNIGYQGLIETAGPAGEG